MPQGTDKDIFFASTLRILTLNLELGCPKRPFFGRKRITFFETSYRAYFFLIKLLFVCTKKKLPARSEEVLHVDEHDFKVTKVQFFKYGTLKTCRKLHFQPWKMNESTRRS